MQLLFVQLSLVRSVAIDHPEISVRKRVRARAHAEALKVPEVLMAIKAQGNQCKANRACLTVGKAIHSVIMFFRHLLYFGKLLG